MATRSLNHSFLLDSPVPASRRGGTRTVSAPSQRPPRLVLAWTWLRDAYRRHRSRTVLSQLDAYQLKDIGLSFSEAENEANKPFWRN
jgi:uncharacterized protein YjiS (DUF1127 family)